MMVLQESLVQTVLTKTILMTCGKTLSYNEQFSVEGSLQITVDKNEIILIEVKDTVLKWDLDNLPDVKEEIAEIHLPNKQSKEKKSKKPAMSKKRKRKCKTQRENKSDCGPDDNNFENIIFSTEDYPTETDSQISKFPEEGSHLPLLSNIESEVPREGDVGFGGVVIKEEEPFLNNDTSQELVALVDGQPAVDVAQPANLLSGQVEEIASDMQSLQSEGSGSDDNKELRSKDLLQEPELTHEESVKEEDGNQHQAMEPQTMDATLKYVHPGFLGGILDPKFNMLNEYNELYTPEKTKHQRDKKITYKCCVCAECFQTGAELEKHCVMTHNIKNYLCRFCGKTFPNLSYLNVHESSHSTEKPFQCNVCSKCFKTKVRLCEHVRNCHNKKSFVCQICGYILKTSKYLYRHQKIHTDHQMLQCRVCGKSIMRKSDMDLHYRTIHMGEKPYKCNICFKQFAQGGTLTKHERTHTGEKPYKCKECNKCFSLSDTLTKHMRTHTGEKPFMCDHCGKSFSTRPSLNTHRRIHTGEKPHRCSICGAGFDRPSWLKVHIDKKHKD